MTFDRELDCLNDEVHASVDTDGIVEREKVVCKFVSECCGDVGCDDAPDSRGDADGSKFVGVVWIFV